MLGICQALGLPRLFLSMILRPPAWTTARAFSALSPIGIVPPPSLYPFRVPGKEHEDGDRLELWMPEFTGYIDNISITGPPGKVTDLVIFSNGNDIHLYWQASSNAGGYSIRRSLEPFGTFTEIGTVVADSLHFEHTNGAGSDVRAFYSVVATD